MIDQNLIAARIDSLLKTTATQDQATSAQNFKDGLAKIIVDAIKSAQVTLPTGSVVVVGSAVTQQNPAAIIVPSALS